MFKNVSINKRVPVSVLMSLYHKEKASNLEECLQSLLNQTYQADEWVIVKDGPLSEEIENVLAKYNTLYPDLIKYVIFNTNMGLGLALQAGVLACKNELIARMDTDDICRNDRIEIQYKEFMSDPKLDIVGSHIFEFENEVSNIISERKVPLSNEQIIEYQKKRSAYNHMTVMYKKSAVINAGNYEHAPLMEDDMLWTRMILSGCNGKNIDDFLVFARTGIDMIERRGGWEYFKKYKASRKKVYQLGLASFWQYYETLVIQFFVSLSPKILRKIIFIKMLRK